MNQGAILLDDLERTPDGYTRLLARSGSISIAAYSVAVARLMCWERTTAPIPTWRELRACMFEVAERSDYVGHLPNAKDLVRECRALGHPVLPKAPVF